jgi:hypothetical protein
MKRFTIVLIAAVSTVLAITAVATSNFSSDDKHPGHHQEKNKTQHSPPSVDGSVNPELIPDAAAYEILFRLLSTNNPNENDTKASQRKSAYLRVAGFSDAEAAAISNTAYEYKRQIDPLDTEVDQIKNQHWPNPDLNVMGQLKQKQKQKEDIMSSLEGGLKGQLNNYNASAKLDKHITGRIKKKTKGFNVGLPPKKISSIGDYFSNLFSVSAQAPGCDTSIYIYVDTVVSMDSFMVYGSSSFSLPYDNCGHSVTLNTNLNGVTSPLEISLTDGVNYIDGLFQTDAQADVYCPVANQTYWGGDNADAETAISINIGGGGNKSISGGQTISVAAAYAPRMITSNPTKIKARAIVTSSIRVERGDQTSTSILTITPSP